MRAAAIVLVLLHHCGFWFAHYKLVFGLACVSGYFGVELFFVLSGFLIGSILFRWLTNPNPTGTLFGFWGRRWLRTLPNYFLFLIVNWLVSVLLYHRQPSVWRSALFLQNINSPPGRFFGESWSLAVEEWFYLLIPLLFLVAVRLSPRLFRLSSLFICCAVIGIITIARCVYVINTNPVWLTGVRQIVIYRLDACMFGVIAAWSKHFYPARWRQPSLVFFSAGIAILVVIGVLPFVLSNDSIFLRTAGFTVTSLAAAFLLPTLNAWITATSGRFGLLVVNISQWSYSLYLVHMLVFAFLLRWLQYTSPVFCTVAFVTLSLTLAAVVYRFYERPIMNLRDRFGRKRAVNADPLPLNHVFVS